MKRTTSVAAKRFRLVTTLLVAMVFIAGCSRTDGPERYKVSGSVQFKGQPVPAGTIIFEPDPSKGNSGPASYAQIKEGRYATERGQGCVGGPCLVRIAGADGVPVGDLSDGKALFPEYRTAVELPKAASKQDFVVPAERK